MKTTCQKINNKLAFSDKLKVDEYISKMSEGKVYSFEIKQFRTLNLGSDPQRKYYFGVIIPMWQEYIGEDNKNEMHETLKHNFAPRDVLESGLEKVLGYSQMSVEQREVYHEKCRRNYFSLSGGHIPLPNEVPESLYDDLQNNFEASI